MTFKEKFLSKKYMNDSEFSKFSRTFCPYQIFLEEHSPCKQMRGNCKECWNREMPNTEVKEDEDKEWLDGYEKGKIDGLNDAWELANKCVHLEGCGEDNELMYKIFNTVFIKQLFDDNSPQEALEKLKAYEEAQKIEVGDVVKNVVCDEVFVGVISNIDHDVATVMWSDGTSGCIKRNELENTGRHINIQQILNQIGKQI